MTELLLSASESKTRGRRSDILAFIMRMLRNPRAEVPQTTILSSKQQSLADREFIDTAALVLLAGTQHGRGPFGLVRRVGVFLGLQADGRPESVNGAL